MQHAGSKQPLAATRVECFRTPNDNSCELLILRQCRCRTELSQGVDSWLVYQGSVFDGERDFQPLPVPFNFHCASFGRPRSWIFYAVALADHGDDVFAHAQWLSPTQVRIDILVLSLKHTFSRLSSVESVC